MSFATGIIGTLDTGTGRLEWTCAGHPPPLLLRGRVHELECTPTIPFGLGARNPGIHSLDLKPDDTVLIYTDGVTEAADPQDDMFSEARLEAVLRAAAGGTSAEMVKSVTDAVRGFVGTALPSDDITMLAIRRLEAGAV